MKNNYDLILNFEENDGESIPDGHLEYILMEAVKLSKILEHNINVTVWKAIISQAVDSEKIPHSLQGSAIEE